MVTLSVCPFDCDALHCGCVIHRTVKVPEQVNRKCPPGNMTLQLSVTTPILNPQTPHPKFPNFFKGGMWLYRTSYGRDVWTLNKRKVQSAILATAELLVKVIMEIRAVFQRRRRLTSWEGAGSWNFPASFRQQN